MHTNMTNKRDTPVEALEHAYPIRVRRYTLRTGSGGAGRFVKPKESAAVALLKNKNQRTECSADREQIEQNSFHGGKQRT